MVELNQKVVVITGATGGLGKVATQKFSALGARLALVSSQQEELENLMPVLKLPAEQALTICADLTLPESAPGILEAVIARFGTADILLHLVGGWVGGTPIAATKPEDISRMLLQHLWTTFYMTQTFAPHMMNQGWGRIIIVSSPTVAAPPAKSSPYAIGKSAQEALMLTLAEECKGTGVTANILRVRAIDVHHERIEQPSPKNASWTTPEEITEAIVFLCSETAGMVNGARIPLYGSP